MSILYLYQIDNKLRSNKTCPSQVKPCSLQFNIDFNITHVLKFQEQHLK